MPKTTQITVTVTVSRVIRTADYENFQTTISEVVELDSKDDCSKVRTKKLQELTRLIDKKEKSVRKTFKT